MTLCGGAFNGCSVVADSHPEHISDALYLGFDETARFFGRNAMLNRILYYRLQQETRNEAGRCLGSRFDRNFKAMAKRTFCIAR